MNFPRTHVARWTLTLGILWLAAGCTSTSPSDYVLPPEEEAKSPTTGSVFRCQAPLNEESLLDDLVWRIQAERDRAGLPPLVIDETLSLVAEDYACRMIEGNFFAHLDPETLKGPGERVTDKGYVFHTVGENLAAGQQTASDVVEQWMASPSHRANILGETWRETGLAVCVGGRYGTYWVQLFADPVDLDLFTTADSVAP